MKKRVLIVEDDTHFLLSLKNHLSPRFDIYSASNREEAVRRLRGDIDILLADIRLGGEGNEDGIEVLREAKTKSPEIPIIMMTAYGRVDLAVKAMKLGAYDFLSKPINLEELELVLEKAIEDSRLKKELALLKSKINRYEPWELIGESSSIVKLRELTREASRDGKVSVLIQGESGTGKELVARAIHHFGPRSDGPFIAASLKAESPTTIESTLFGHEKGAFTDAREQRKGLLELADGGVLFLDEIAELDTSLQSKLLRVLETRTFRRMGGSQEIEVDFQLVCATNANLERLISDGKFREDLFYRINVYPITTPPLREHPEDIPLLIKHFLEGFGREGRTVVRRVSPEAMSFLTKQSWPGNVRELKNVIERVAIRVKDEEVTLEDLFESFSLQGLKESQSFGAPTNAFSLNKDFDLYKTTASLQLSYVEEALKKTDGKKDEAWRVLGLHHRHTEKSARHALRRLVEGLFKNYPELIQEHPYLAQKYKRPVQTD